MFRRRPGNLLWRAGDSDRYFCCLIRIESDKVWRRVGGLTYYCEGELVVSLGDECDCVAVSGLELE